MITRKCMYTLLWIFWLLAILSSVVFGALSTMLLVGLQEWAYEQELGDVVALASELSGVIGCSGIMLIGLLFYFTLSSLVLLWKLCSKPSVLDFPWGALTASTFYMVLITAQAALTIEASMYLAATVINFEATLPLNLYSSTDDELFQIATIMGYITSGLYLVVFCFMAGHHWSVAFNCCVNEEEKSHAKGNNGSASSKSNGSTAGTSSTSAKQQEPGARYY